MPSLDPTLRVARRLAEIERVTVLTGAGVSAASGVPTFRGRDGLWRTFRPEELATPHAFARDPRLVWEWYDWRRQRIAACSPNRVHEVLAEWSRRYPRFRLITQNVDGLHERAGTQHVLRYHGSIWDVRCAGGCARDAWLDVRVPLPDLPPRCPRCDGPLRPDVVWFGEPVDPRVAALARDATLCDVFFTIGTSAVVYPAAGLAHEARARGAMTVEINPEPTEATALVDVALQGPAEDVLDALDRAVCKIAGSSSARGAS
ncbi:MAG: NAD-dependent deacylase [Acidobacteria bacterium]|nr:NAD-dependent deacylase [Acidobacteriota bacterium]